MQIQSSEAEGFQEKLSAVPQTALCVWEPASSAVFRIK